MDDWMWVVRLASSRLVYWRVVSSRFVQVGGRDSYGRESSNGGIGRRMEAAIPVQGARRLYGDGDAGRAGDGQGMQQ